MNTKSTRRVNAVLTHRAINALEPTQKAYRVPDARCPGLGIRVAPSGLKTWDAVFRIRGTGVVKRKALGAFPAVSLDEARSRAAALGGAAQVGRDLLSEEANAKLEAAARTTISRLIEEYVMRACGKLRTKREIELRLKRALASIAEDAAESVRRRDLRRILDAVYDRGAPREAEKQRQSIGAMFNWATSQDIVPENPVRGLKSYSAGETRDRVLSDEEIRIFWEWLGVCDLSPDIVDALRLQICFGSRIGETAGMHAEEIDQAQWLWTLPAARSKNKRQRVTPILGLAREIIVARLEKWAGGALFTNETGAALRSNDIGSAILTRRKRMPLAHFVSHDLRRTVATHLVDLGLSYDVVAGVLGHDAGDKNTRTLIKHYVRSDLIPQKRFALERWDARLRAIICRDKAPNPNVLRFGNVEQRSCYGQIVEEPNLTTGLAPHNL